MRSHKKVLHYPKERNRKLLQCMRLCFGDLKWNSVVLFSLGTPVILDKRRQGRLSVSILDVSAIILS